MSARGIASAGPRTTSRATCTTRRSPGSVSADASGITVETAGNQTLTLGAGRSDAPRLDLAYALNMHMAQGITTDKAITASCDSHERNLVEPAPVQCGRRGCATNSP